MPSRVLRTIPLPRLWPARVKQAVLHVISLAQYASAYTRGWAADSVSARVRLKAENDRLRQEVQFLREELRIKDARMARIDPHRRPFYPPTERLAILGLKAARGWSLERAAKAILVAPATIASWMRRLDEQGPDALVQLPQPVNRFPQFVRCAVERLKKVCPTLGKAKIAQTLARAGLHLAATTVGRMLNAPGRPDAPGRDPAHRPLQPAPAERVVTARYPNHVWHVDLTVAPTGLGMWCSWSPLALPQCWPFCHWVAAAVDHFSRRTMGCATFARQPTSHAVRGFLGRAIAKAGNAPRYIVCDRGRQFDCEAFRQWCRRKGIKRPRYGAVGKHGSIAVVERFILTLKGLLACLPLVPYRRGSFQRELEAIVEWHNQHRPHTCLGGRTPDEVYFARFPANRRPRFEPRARWPRGSPCARPWALVRGRPGAKLDLEIRFHAGRRHLPIVTLRRVA